MVFVNPINAEDIPTASAPPTHLMFSKLGFRAKSLVMETPIIEEKSWPRMTLRGWERGESIVLYSRIADAPSDPITVGAPSDLRSLT